MSWLVTHLYYKKSSKEIPSWAEDIVDRLPETPPTEQKLLELFQDSLDSGKVSPHHVVGHVACPECKTPQDQFEEDGYSDAEGYRGVIVVSCPNCTWRQEVEW